MQEVLLTSLSGGPCPKEPCLLENQLLLSSKTFPELFSQLNFALSLTS